MVWVLSAPLVGFRMDRGARMVVPGAVAAGRASLTGSVVRSSEVETSPDCRELNLLGCRRDECECLRRDVGICHVMFYNEARRSPRANKSRYIEESQSFNPKDVFAF